MKPARLEKFSSGVTAIIVVVLVILSLAIGAGALFGYQKYFKEQPELNKEEDSKIAKLESPEASPSNETSSWKTYTSPCGFSIKYPSGYKLESAQKICGSGHHQDSSIVSQDNGQSLMVNIYVDSSPKSTNFDDEIGSYIGIAKTDQESTTFQGAPAIKFKPTSNEQVGFSGGISTGILILRNGKFVQFSVTGDETTISAWDQILSTFKFIN